MDDSQKKQIGHNIRVLRLHMGLTQTQLAGDSVSRNMLSLIENGNAVPSLATLSDFSQRLQVPISYFFAQSDDETENYFQDTEKSALRQQYKNGLYAECAEKCKAISNPDDEILLLFAKSCQKLAQNATQKNCLQSAIRYYSQIQELAEKSIYLGAEFSDTAGYMILFLQNATNETLPPELLTGKDFPQAQISAEQRLYLLALQKADTDFSEKLLADGLIFSPAFAAHLQGKIAEKNGQNAYPFYKKSLSENPIFYTHYHILAALSAFAEQKGDYRNAYAYTKQRTQLLEQFAK